MAVIPFGERKGKPWWDLCLKTDKGKIYVNLANAMIALRMDHDVRDVYAYDEMLRTEVVTHKIGRIDTLMRPLAEHDIMDLQEWFQVNGLPGMGVETVRMAILLRAHENKFHPVKDYLKSLMHDGVPRLGTWLSVYLGAELGPYNAHIGRMFLTSMVARIAQPGCQADHMPVLEGPQGILKSSACKVLGGEWFSDCLPDITSGKDASAHLKGRWLVEVSEMHALGRAEATLLKSFISRREERYRPSYGRVEVHEPRQCVFAGTTNMDAYLRDSTGGRRFWPVKTGVTGEIKLGLLEEYRDQLFAEAVQNYQQGGTWWPDQQFENECIKPQQSARYAGDLWDEKIEQYVSPLSRVKVTELATHVLGFSAKDLRPEHQGRITAVLRDLGWVSKRNGRERWWEPPGSEYVKPKASPGVTNGGDGNDGEMTPF